MKSNYKRIGEYIRQVNNRNKDLKVSNLLGINIDKFFMPSVANIVGTDLSVYKKVSKGQFACNRMHVGRDMRLPVALSKNDEDFIVSPAYDVFEIIDEKELLPEYLMMWFSRKEFDRNAWFYTDADVRQGLSWDAFINIELPVPDITKQQEIVDEYNAIKNRISLNNSLIEKLEETAKSIYKEWFVDFEFPDKNGKPYKSSGGEMEFCSEFEKEVPKGWKYEKLGNFCDLITAGGTPSREINEYWDRKEVPWIKNGEIKNNIIFKSEEYISKDGLNNSSAKILPKKTVLVAMYCVSNIQVSYLVEEASTNQACCGLFVNNDNKSAYLYYYLKYSGNDLVSFANGSAQVNLSKDIISSYGILVPKDEIIDNEIFKKNLDYKEKITRENYILEKTKDLILSKMASEG